MDPRATGPAERPDGQDDARRGQGAVAFLGQHQRDEGDRPGEGGVEQEPAEDDRRQAADHPQGAGREQSRRGHEQAPHSGDRGEALPGEHGDALVSAELDEAGGGGDEDAEVGGAPVQGAFVRAVRRAVVLMTDGS